MLGSLYQLPRSYWAYLIPGMSPAATLGSGTFSHFNGLGAVLCAILPVAFGWWLAKMNSIARMLVFAIIAAGVVTTYSRGALIGAVAGCVLVLFFQRGRSRRSMALLVSCVALLAALLMVNTAMQYYETTQNVDVRTQTWRIAMDKALTSPSNLVFGYGYTYFHDRVLSPDGTSRVVHSGTMASLHSGPLQLLLEFGLVGVVLLIIWLVSTGRSALGPRRTTLSVAFFAGALSFMAHQALDTVDVLVPRSAVRDPSGHGRGRTRPEPRRIAGHRRGTGQGARAIGQLNDLTSSFLCTIVARPTRRCLDALAAQTAAGKTVIVVDDGSSDGTREMLESYPDVVTLRGDGALWWTGATNVGCGWALSRAADDDAVVTLNDDTIPGPGWLESLLDAAGSSPHSLIGSLLVDSATGRIMDAGTRSTGGLPL